MGQSQLHRLKRLMRSTACALACVAALGSSASAQQVGLRGTVDGSDEPRSPFADLQVLNQQLLRRDGERPPVDDPVYNSENPSVAEEEAERLETLLRRQRGEADPETNEDGATDGATVAAAPLRPRPEPDATVTGSLQQGGRSAAAVGAVGEPLPRGAEVADDGTVLTELEAERERFSAAGRVEPVEPVEFRDFTREENPFEASGIRMGSMILRPTLEQGIEHSIQSGATTTGSATASSASTSSLTTLGFTAESEWRAGELEADGFLRWRETLDGADESEPEAAFNLRLTQHIAEDWQWSLDANYAAQREDAIDTLVTTPLLGAPQPVLSTALEQTLGAGVSMSRTDGKLRPTLGVSLSHTWFGDAEDAIGQIYDQSSRDVTTLRGTGRLAYEVSPFLIPFVEGQVARNWRSGSDTTEYRGTIGTTLNASEKLSATLGVGWALLEGSDTTPNFDGLVLDGSVTWSPERETSITAALATELARGDATGETGTIAYQGTLTFDRQINERLDLSATLGAEFEREEATGREDTTLSAEVSGTWWLSRYLGLTGRARHEQLTSSQAGRESETTTFFLGLRAQR